MTPPAGRPAGPLKQPVQVRLSEEELSLIDVFVAELSRQAFGATFSRAEGLKLAALTWLRQRYATSPTAPSARVYEAASGESLLTESALQTTAPPAPPRGHGLPRATLECIAEERMHCEGLSLNDFAQHLHDKGIYSSTTSDGSRVPVHKGTLRRWLERARAEGLL
jgi:hypothetical protein